MNLIKGNVVSIKFASIMSGVNLTLDQDSNSYCLPEDEKTAIEEAIKKKKTKTRKTQTRKRKGQYMDDEGVAMLVVEPQNNLDNENRRVSKRKRIVKVYTS